MVLYRNIYTTKTQRQLFEEKRRNINLMKYQSELSKLEQHVKFCARKGIMCDDSVNRCRFLKKKIYHLCNN